MTDELPHIRSLREGLLELTERVLEGASPAKFAPDRRRHAAHTYVVLMLDDANARRYDGPGPDLAGAASIVATGLTAASAPHCIASI